MQHVQVTWEQYSEALERVDGDKWFLDELVDIYYTDASQRIDAMHRAVKERDFEVIRREAHTLKGASANLSLESLREISVQLEVAGHENDLEKAEKYLESFVAKFAELFHPHQNPGKRVDPSPAPASRKNEKTVLIIDDDPVTVKLLCNHFENLNWNVLTAENGSLGLELATQEKPDLLITDMLLPGTHGVEICRQVKQNPLLTQTRIVLITSVYNKMSYLNGDMDCEKDGFLEKPVSADKLNQVISLLFPVADAPRKNPGNQVRIRQSFHNMSERAYSRSKGLEPRGELSPAPHARGFKNS
ncbi:MAG: response regulator [Candidatus Aminicenantes bacterium]|nr:response regulator [Candidatus Aminicenantes bacterium]